MADIKIIFPRKTVSVGDCIAVASLPTSRGPGAGKPIKGALYTVVKHEVEKWLGHRLSFCLNKQSVPRCSGQKKEGLVLHTCDNKWCINPDHLYLGTSSDNAKDRWARNHSFRTNASASYSKAAKRRWAKPEERKAQAKRTASNMTPEVRKKISDKVKTRWEEGRYANRSRNA